MASLLREFHEVGWIPPWRVTRFLWTLERSRGTRLLDLMSPCERGRLRRTKMLRTRAQHLVTDAATLRDVLTALDTLATLHQNGKRA